jgi:hypothetical protein
MFSSSYLRNISSMRRVTAKPPNMLIVASPMPPTGQPADPLVRPRKVGGDLGEIRRDLHQRADGDDAADRVGHAHQRRVQRGGDVSRHHVADEAGQDDHGEVREEARRREAADEQEQERSDTEDDGGLRSGHRAAGRAVSLRLPRHRGRLAAAAAGAADSFGAGGGQVTSPLLMTVVPRRTSSFMSTLMTSPSMLLVLIMSSIRRKRFVAYSVDACFAKRPRQVFVADDRDAVPHDDLARHGELAVAALLGGHVDDDAALLHRLDHVFGDELRRGLAGISAVVMMMSTSFACFANTSRCASGSLRSSPWRSRRRRCPPPQSRRGTYFAAQRFDLIRDFGPRVVGAHDGAQAGRGADGGRPATPAPMTKTLAGGTLPAAVIEPVKKRPEFVRRLDDRAVASDICHGRERVELLRARDARHAVIASTVAFLAASCCSNSGFCAGQMKLTTVPPSRSRPISSLPGARTLKTMSDVAQSFARSSTISPPRRGRRHR